MKLFNISFSNSLYLNLSFVFLIVLLLLPSMSSKAKKQLKEKSEIEVIDKEYHENEFHNDFQRVGSATDPTHRPIKPIDLAGDPIIHARETLEEDLLNLEMDNNNEDKK